MNVPVPKDVRILHLINPITKAYLLMNRNIVRLKGADKYKDVLLSPDVQIQL